MKPSHSGLSWILDWTGVLALNLPVSLWLAVHTTDSDGWMGIGLAIGLVWLAGIVILWCSEWWAKVLVRGSLVPMFCQFFPVAHVLVGLFAIGCWHDISGHGDLGTPLTGFGAFVVTLLCAFPFVLLALLCGWSFTAGEAQSESTVACDEKTV